MVSVQPEAAEQLRAVAAEHVRIQGLLGTGLAQGCGAWAVIRGLQLG